MCPLNLSGGVARELFIWLRVVCLVEGLVLRVEGEEGGVVEQKGGTWRGGGWLKMAWGAAAAKTAK